MIFVYDILLNWFEEGRMIEFFEWDLNDELEHIKKIPLFRVERETLQEIVRSFVQFSSSFLEKIKNKTEGYYHNEVDTIFYACLLSDGEKCIALELDEKGRTLYKSSLLLDEEEEILELVEELTTMTLDYEVCSKEIKKENGEYLTRTEQQNKNYLVKELKKMWHDQELSKVGYLYEECLGDEREKEVVDKYNKLMEIAEKEYTSLHERMIEILQLASPHSTKQ